MHNMHAQETKVMLGLPVKAPQDNSQQQQQQRRGRQRHEGTTEAAPSSDVAH